MDQTRLESIRQLTQSATPDPRVGTDANEVFFRTDAAHYKADVHLVREARSIILDLLDEIERLGNPTTHEIYAAATRQVVTAQEALDAEEMRIRWAAHGGYADFVDG